MLLIRRKTHKYMVYHVVMYTPTQTCCGARQRGVTTAAFFLSADSLALVCTAERQTSELTCCNYENC